MQPTSLSLLGIAQESNVDDEAWGNLHTIYEPLIRQWLRSQQIAGADADDLAQEVMLVVLKKLPSFEHNGRPGAFRKWLRLVVFNCTRDFWKAKKIRPRTVGTGFVQMMDQLKDDSSELTQKWNLEHDLLVMNRLLGLVKIQVHVVTWTAFERLVLEGRSVAETQDKLGISTASVYAAKSRVLAKLKEMSSELID